MKASPLAMGNKLNRSGAFLLQDRSVLFLLAAVAPLPFGQRSDTPGHRSLYQTAWRVERPHHIHRSLRPDGDGSGRVGQWQTLRFLGTKASHGDRLLGAAAAHFVLHPGPQPPHGSLPPGTRRYWRRHIRRCHHCVCCRSHARQRTIQFTARHLRHRPGDRRCGWAYPLGVILQHLGFHSTFVAFAALALLAAAIFQLLVPNTSSEEMTYRGLSMDSAVSTTMERFFSRHSVSMNESSGTGMLSSLRSRILLLALLVCVLLASALTGFFLLLRRTQSALITDSASNLLGDREYICQ